MRRRGASATVSARLPAGDPHAILSGTMITGLLGFWAGRFLLVATVAALALSLLERARSGSAASDGGPPAWGIAAGFVAASVSTYWMWKLTCPVPRHGRASGA